MKSRRNLCARCSKPRNNYEQHNPFDGHAFADARPTGIQPRSTEMARFYREERIPLVKEVLERDNYQCQIRAPGCTVQATTCHEVLTRGRGGGIRAEGINDASNMLAACTQCNSWVGENSYEAEQMGVLKHGWEAEG